MNFLYILLAIFIFGGLIFIHELGHFLVARLCGVKVLEFAIGMGPKVLSWRSKKSGTAYSLRLLPLGGFVNMLGEDGMELVQGASSEDPPAEGQKDTFLVTSEAEEASKTEPKTLSEEEAKQAYCNQSVWKRMAISLAGPVMNLILGFLLMLVMVVASGHDYVGTTVVANFHVVYSAEEAYGELQPNDYIVGVDLGDGEGLQPVRSFQNLKNTVNANDGGTFGLLVQRLNEDGSEILSVEIEEIVLTASFLETSFQGSLSEGSGLQVGDEILKVNNTRVHTAHELSYEVMNQGYQALSLTVKRGEEKITLDGVLVPSFVDTGVTFGEMDFQVYQEPSFHLGTVLKHTWFRSCSTVKMVFDSLAGLFSGRYGFEAVSGPVGITKTISDMAKIGWMNVLYLVTVISINLGIMNLLPIPGLDGGHLLIYLIEVVRGKPMKRELEGVINFVGLVIMLALAIIIAIKDFITL